MWEAGIAILLLGCVPVAIKFSSANPYSIGLFRLSVALLAMLCSSGLRQQLRTLSLSQLKALFPIGLIFGLHWLTYFISIKLSSASTAAIGLSSYGIHLMLMGALFQKRFPGWQDLLAFGMVFAGNSLVVPEYSFSSSATIGFLLGVLSGFFYACLPLLHQRHANMPSQLRIFGQFAFAWLLFAMLSPKAEWDLQQQDWLALLFLGIGGTLIAHSLWVRCTTQLSTTVTSIIYYGFVPVALLVSYLVLDEQIDLRKGLGAALVLSGGLLGVLARMKSGSLLAKNDGQR